MRRPAAHAVLLALVAGLVLLGLAVPGLDTGLLLLSPALVLLVPLAVGRYVGADAIERLAARRAARIPRAARALPAPCMAPVRAVRGGRLIAHALAERGPPQVVATS